jgi:phosphatidylinositol-3-phosphatase
LCFLTRPPACCREARRAVAATRREVHAVATPRPAMTRLSPRRSVARRSPPLRLQGLRLIAVLVAALVVAGCSAMLTPHGPPSIRVAPGSSPRGGSVAVIGSGFGAQEAGDLALDGSLVDMPAYLATSQGTFRMAFTVPPSASPGRHAVTALDQAGRILARASLTVTKATVTGAASGSLVAGITGSAQASPALASPSPGGSGTAQGSAAPMGPGLDGMPGFEHVYVIVLENKEYGSVIGESSAPYLNSLAAKFGVATNYDAVAHGIADYFALLSGSTHGITGEGVYDLSGTNLFDQLESHGLTWKVFAENVPPDCYLGVQASGGEDGPGTYVRRHEPAIDFRDISGAASRCANITDLTHFDPAAANFELIIPNACHDMEACSVAAGDAWLSSFVPHITSSPAFGNSVLFITFDEGRTNVGGGGHVATIVVSPLGTRHFASAEPLDHYSLLRTIEDAWRLGCLGSACSATDMHAFFR